MQTAAMTPPTDLVRLAEAQLGVVSRAQLVAAIGASRTDALLRSAWVEAIEFGVRRIRGSARIPVQRAFAATLRAGRGATLTGPVALTLLDLDGFGAFNEVLPFEVLLPPGRRLRGVDFPHRRDPDPDRPVSRRGEVRIAAPVDALIDSAAFVDQVGARRIRLAHDVLRWRGLLRPGRLTQRIRELGPGVPGGVELATLLELDLRSETGDGERRLGELLALFDPSPIPQHWVTPSRRLDWWFPTVRHGVEYQGTVDHATSVGRRADQQRDGELRREDIRITYVAESDLQEEAALLASLSAALAARAYELGVAAPHLRSH